MRNKQAVLSSLPSVDEVLKSIKGMEWLKRYPRRFVLLAVRETIDRARQAVITDDLSEVHIDELLAAMEKRVRKLSDLSLKPVINATGVVIHTNLGRSVLSEDILLNVSRAACGYSNLEYDLHKGKRGKRHSHAQRLITEITGAEDGLIVNNNAAAVLVCLSALAAGKEVIVSRGELVEIGGSFRVPDVMSASGAILHEVGTTNKTHLHDYERAISEKTGLILKVHQSNYRMVGFTKSVEINELSALGRKHNIPVMFDLGSGCLIDLKPYGVHIEPTVQEIVQGGCDIVTFSGDKLLGGPQGGVIAGRHELLRRISGHPLMRAVRIDKLTLAAFEATLMKYLDEEQAKAEIPTLKALLQDPSQIKNRAELILDKLAGELADNNGGLPALEVAPDSSQSGGGALPEIEFPTWVVTVRPSGLSVNALEERLRNGETPVVARIKDEALVLDARTIGDHEIEAAAKAVAAALCR